jgi:hypothetical protein
MFGCVYLEEPFLFPRRTDQGVRVLCSLCKDFLFLVFRSRLCIKLDFWKKPRVVLFSASNHTSEDKGGLTSNPEVPRRKS